MPVFRLSWWCCFVCVDLRLEHSSLRCGDQELIKEVGTNSDNQVDYRRLVKLMYARSK